MLQLITVSTASIPVLHSAEVAHLYPQVVSYARGSSHLPEMASGLNPAAAPAEIASRDLEEFPGVGAKLGRSSGGAWALRSGGAAAA